VNQNRSALDWLYIIGLSALWGSAFVFIKVATPAIGAVGLVFLRLVLASLLLGALFIRKQHFKMIKENIFPIILIGVTNVALPFYCFSYAALEINASTMAVINGSTPLFAFVFSIFWLNFQFKWFQFLGILIGMSGLMVFVGYESLEFKLFPMFMAMIGAAMYGLSMNYIYKLNVVDTGVMAAVTMVAATIMIAPFLLLDPIIMENWNLKIAASVIFLGVFCTGLAYLPYFILIKRVGPISTSLVALLVPIFGMLWAYLLLQETITLVMLTGCLLIIGGVVLTSRLGKANR
jgi:drug/metabolite transporter (DMT)-like permease|tara:strand:- start:3748 stop:4620 length:873 start_codon:yes stop_codon:yes gene_type:complete